MLRQHPTTRKPGYVLSGSPRHCQPLPLILLICIMLITACVSVSPALAGNLNTYQANYPEYLQKDKVVADTFLANYNRTQAQAIVARAIWYMQNGYMVYGHSKYWDTGYIDCSNFVSLVYKDFGYKITSASKNYDTVGQKVPGVYSRQIPGSNKYELVGIENLRPGDIFTYWKDDADGSGTHIGHVALYMGQINGRPAIIQTVEDRPTAIGVTTDFRYFYGEHFVEARRVLDVSAYGPGKAWQAAAPVIPAVYQLTPQKKILMPEPRFMGSDPATDRDVAGHWAETTINKMIKAKVISGYPDGSFRPDAPISRAEFATAVVKAFEIPASSGTIFSDTASHWARASIATLEGRGIISGYSPTWFGPDDPLTREQMTTIVTEAADPGNKAIHDQPDFRDSAAISAWAEDAVAIAVEEKLISGYPDDTFQPQSLASRAEAVTLINKALTLK